MQDNQNKDTDSNEETKSDVQAPSSTPNSDIPPKKEGKKQLHKLKTFNSEYTEENCPFTSGDELTFINIRFPGNAKPHPFLTDGLQLSYRQKVVAMSDRGMTVGYVNSLPYEKNFTKGMLPIRKILRIATDEDLQEQKDKHDAEVRAENVCLRLIEKFSLKMNITHVEIIQFGKKAVFYFTAPERVDFRELVKGLVSELKTRIELRQITLRDRSAAIGALGSCGRQCCCSSFLKNYGNASIKMAKNQNLALLPNKINGVCGQLKCCMRYEDDVYTDKRSRLPEEGRFIKTKNGDCGKVLRLHIIIDQFDMLTDKGQKRRYTLEQYNRRNRTPEGWKFPNRFDHITDETSEIIGKISRPQIDLAEDQEVKAPFKKPQPKKKPEKSEQTVEAKEAEGDKKDKDQRPARKRPNRSRNRNRRPSNKDQNKSTEKKDQSNKPSGQRRRPSDKKQKTEKKDS